MSHIQRTIPNIKETSSISKNASKTKYAILGGLLVTAIISIILIIIYFKTRTNVNNPLQQEPPKKENQSSPKKDDRVFQKIASKFLQKIIINLLLKTMTKFLLKKTKRPLLKKKKNSS